MPQTKQEKDQTRLSTVGVFVCLLLGVLLGQVYRSLSTEHAKEAAAPVSLAAQVQAEQEAAVPDIARAYEQQAARASGPLFSPVAAGSGRAIRIVNRRVPDSLYEKWMAEDAERIPPGVRPRSISEWNHPLPPGLDRAQVDQNLRMIDHLRPCFTKKGVPPTGQALVIAMFKCTKEMCTFDKAQLDATTMPQGADALVTECVANLFKGKAVANTTGESDLAVPQLFPGDLDQHEVYRALSAPPNETL